MTDTLGDAFPRELERCKQLLEQYRGIGPAGIFGASIITDVVNQAQLALYDGDAVAMVRLYEEMRGLE